MKIISQNFKLFILMLYFQKLGPPMLLTYSVETHAFMKREQQFEKKKLLFSYKYAGDDET